jgi:aminoglycoside phosphotransferase (APT) family kinase protein
LVDEAAWPARLRQQRAWLLSPSVRVHFVLTPEIAARALRAAGFDCAPETLRVQARDSRWAVHMPDWRLAWFAATEPGVQLLDRERRVLQLIEAHCSFTAPRVLYESSAGDFDVRALVPGENDPFRLYHEVQRRPDLGLSIGAALGGILVEQHTKIPAADAASWLPAQASWPLPLTLIRDQLPEVIDDAELIAKATAVIAAFEAVRVAEDDRVLVHGDLGFHNLAYDFTEDRVLGVFDYGDASWSDRHHDFRLLVFGHDHDEVLDGALAVYEPALGRKIDRSRVHLYNAAIAVSYLAYRAGTPPEADSCGRTLTEDLRWTTHAIRKALSGLA